MKTTAQIRAAIEALSLQGALYDQTGDPEQADLIMGYAGVLKWVSEDGSRAAEIFDQMVNVVTAEFDQLMTAYNEAHPGEAAT